MTSVAKGLGAFLCNCLGAVPQARELVLVPKLTLWLPFPSEPSDWKISCPDVYTCSERPQEQTLPWSNTLEIL